jgi:hypothetical protein
MNKRRRYLAKRRRAVRLRWRRYYRTGDAMSAEMFRYLSASALDALAPRTVTMPEYFAEVDAMRTKP